MLGIYEAPWELIREDTVTKDTEDNIIISTDNNGEPFELTDVVIKVESPVQETEFKIGGSGVISFYPNVGARFAVECGGYMQSANASGNVFIAVMKQHGNMVEIYRSSRASYSNTGMLGYRVGQGLYNIGEADNTSDRMNISVNSQTIYIYKLAIGKVTGTVHYRLYGKRKWQ